MLETLRGSEVKGRNHASSPAAVTHLSVAASLAVIGALTKGTDYSHCESRTNGALPGQSAAVANVRRLPRRDREHQP